MKANLGNIDRALRVIVGLVLIGLSVGGVIGWWGWLGVILLATAFISFCPLYAMLRINTGKRRHGTRTISRRRLITTAISVAASIGTMDQFAPPPAIPVRRRWTWCLPPWCAPNHLLLCCASAQNELRHASRLGGL